MKIPISSGDPIPTHGELTTRAADCLGQFVLSQVQDERTHTQTTDTEERAKTRKRLLESEGILRGATIVVESMDLLPPAGYTSWSVFITAAREMSHAITGLTDETVSDTDNSA